MSRTRPLFNPRWNTAAQGARPQVPERLVDLLASLRAAYMVYRNAHWQVKGAGYYGNHLLLERIYEDSAKNVDAVAERIVGYYGPGAVELSGRQTDQIQAAIATFESAGDDPLERSLAAADHVRTALKNAYDVLKSDGTLSLGWDDLLMTISSQKDEHVYLLQQALDGHEVKLVDRAANPGALKRRLSRE